MRFVLTAGYKRDVPQSEALPEGLPEALPDGLGAETALIDAAYNRDHLREPVAEKDAQAVIPNRPTRSLKHRLSRMIYEYSYLIC